MWHIVFSQLFTVKGEDKSTPPYRSCTVVGARMLKDLNAKNIFDRSAEALQCPIF